MNVSVSHWDQKHIYARPKGNEPFYDRSRLFAMYHKKTHDLVKRTIETEFCKENGSVRVVFCTIAFGMGVNVKGGNMVIHLEMLLQKFSFFEKSHAEYVWQCLCDLSESSSSDSDNSVVRETSESEDSDIVSSFVRRHRHYILDSTDESE